jgi:hypothetical protein
VPNPSSSKVLEVEEEEATEAMEVMAMVAVEAMEDMVTAKEVLKIWRTLSKNN